MRRLTLFLILIVLASGGCYRDLGPRSIAVDRTAYIEALGDSWKEQLLFNIVKLRYHDALTLLDVSGITQTYMLDATASAGYDIGWGEGTTTRTVTIPPAGGPTTTSQRVMNLFPRNTFNAGISSTYRNNPTITYAPISGEVIKETIFTRLSPIMIFKALNAAWEPDFIIPYCFVSINNVKGISPEMSDLVVCWNKLKEKKAIHIDIKEVEEGKDATENEGAKGKPDKKGEKILTIPILPTAPKIPKPKPTQQDKLADNLVEFTDNLVKKQKEEAPKKKETAFIILDKLDKAKDPECLVEKFQKLLTLDKLQSFDKDSETYKYKVVDEIPPKKGNLDKIYVRSRSVYQVLYVLANFIDVPDVHKEPHGGESWVWPKIEREWHQIPHFQVRSQRGLMRPDEFVAIKYKGYWFYIPNEDPETKRVFSGLIGILSMMKSAPTEKPILTIPVR